MTTSTHVPDALASLRESFTLHLDATRSPKTSRIYLAALDALIRRLEARGMPTNARGVRREHVESYIASRRETVRPTTLSLEFRALQQFWRWALEEEEIERSPMERMKATRVPDSPVPVILEDDFRKLLKTAEGRTFIDRRDTAILLLMLDTGIRRGELAGLRLTDLDLKDRLVRARVPRRRRAGRRPDATGRLAIGDDGPALRLEPRRRAGQGRVPEPGGPAVAVRLQVARRLALAPVRADDPGGSRRPAPAP